MTRSYDIEQPRITGSKVLDIGADLISEDAGNEEYDRAISEMVCELLDISTDHKDAVLVVLQALKP